MKISFVIPAYNEEKYISLCLAAIVREAKNTNAEIIVVNNGSTDNTKKIATSFPEVLVIDEPRKGITFARQAGFEKSTGDIIAHLDADSIFHPNWIPQVIKKFSKNPALVCLSGPYVYYDLPLLSNIGIRLYYYGAFLGYIFNRFILRMGSLVQGGNFVTTRAAIEKIGGYDTSISFFGEDTDLARRLHNIGQVEFSFQLPLYSSGRRIRSEGLFTMMVKYPINYVWVMLFKKPYTSAYTDFRLKIPKQFTTIRRLNVLLKMLQFVTVVIILAVTALLLHAPFRVSLFSKAEAMEERQENLSITRSIKQTITVTKNKIKGFVQSSY